MFNRPNKAASRAAADEMHPIKTIGSTNISGDLDVPGSENWFYVGNFDYDEIPPHYLDDGTYVAFTDYILKEYEFVIYNEKLEEVGRIKDQMHYLDGKVRVPSCDLAPVVTRHFFNSDDKMEFVVGLAINYKPGENHYRSVVYQLDGEKESGYDKAIYSIEALIGDVLDASATNGGEECTYMTFVTEHAPDYVPPVESAAVAAADEATDGSDNADDESFVEPEHPEESDFWKYAMQNCIEITVYGPAADNNGPQVVLENKIPIFNMPGDQMSTPFLMSMIHDNKPYFVISHYGESFYQPYSNPLLSEIKMREQNTLNVDFWTRDSNGKFNIDYTTVIPFTKDPVTDEFDWYCFYSIGEMRYRGDVDFDNFGTPAGKAALIVTKDKYATNAGEAYISSYYLYDHEGKKLKTYFENSESTMAMSDIPGQEPQQVFVALNYGVYQFTFVDLVSGKVALQFNNQYYVDDEAEDPEFLSANLDRVPAGNSYNVAVEYRNGIVDEFKHTIMRVLWMDNKANYIRTDEIDMGSNVLYGQCFITSEALSPTVFDSDETMEYMMLVKRGSGVQDDTSLTEELMVGKVIDEETGESETLLHILPGEKGNLSFINPYFEGENSKLFIGFYNQETSKYTLDFYRLPLDSPDNSGIDNIVNDNDGKTTISINGSTIEAGGVIEIYTTAGSLVARSNDVLSTSSLTKGLYIIKAGNNAQKLLIK